MRLLLDTHTFIWWDSQPDRLSQRVLELCTAPEHTVMVSMVSLLEIQIKHQLGKLALAQPLPDIIQHQQEQNEIILLSIQPAHIYALGNLPDHHRDPFDRLLVTQAQMEDCTLLSKDPQVAMYPANVIW